MTVSVRAAVSRALTLPAIASGLAAGAVLLTASPTVVQAQAAEGASLAIEEIVVTSRRREETLQSVPVAVTALDERALDALFTSNIGDLSGVAPNFIVGSHGSFPSSAHFTIRGLTSMDIERSFDPSVGVAVDGFFVPTNATQMIDLFDVERVEVLRGPQGTLFGRNTIGGLVNVIRKGPSHERSGDIEGTFGNFGRADLRAAMNTSIVEDVLAARFAVASQNFDGYVFNEFDGRRRGGSDIVSARGALLYTPNKRLTVNFNYDYFRSDSDSGISLNLSDPDGGFLLCAFTECGGIPDDLYLTNENVPNRHDERSHTFLLDVAWDFDQFTLSSLTGYRRHEEDINIDFDGSPLDWYHSLRNQEEVTFSQEFRAITDFDSPLNFVAGLYWFQTRYDLDMDNVFIFFPDGSGQRTGHSSRSAAAYVQGDYSLTDTLRLTLGARYTWEEKELRYHEPFQPDGLVPPIRVEGLKEDWSEFTPRLGLDWQVNDEVLLYASYAAGFKSGGWNGRAGTIASASEPYDPETVDTIEIGLKSDLFDRRMRLNIAAFQSSYEDLQLDINKPLIVDGQANTETVVDNVAKATIRGAELEARLRATEALTLNLTFGWLDASYDRFLADVNADGEVTDNSGLKFRRSPKVQYSAGVNYMVDLGGNGAVSLDALYRWRDSTFLTVLNDETGRQSAVGLLDLSATWFSPSDRYEVSAFVKNATQENYIEYAFVAAGLFQFGSPNAPRTWGVRGRVRF